MPCEDDKVVGDAEFWVVRRWRKYVDGRYWPVRLDEMTPTAKIATIAMLNQGKLVIMPDDTIGEPVEVFEDEKSAAAHREVLTRRHPGEEFRVLLNVDIPD